MTRTTIYLCPTFKISHKSGNISIVSDVFYQIIMKTNIVSTLLLFVVVLYSQWLIFFVCETKRLYYLYFSFNRPLLIILDRHIDLATPLHHTWTYQALAHDLLVYSIISYNPLRWLHYLLPKFYNTFY